MTVGPSTGGSIVFRQSGQLQLSCVLKSTFRLVPDKPMEVTEPEELILSELHYRDNPSRSIRATNEVVPYLPRVDVLLTGHAYAPAGRHVARMTVGLSIYHSIALLEKKIDVVGDRNGSDLVPFQRMPLIYEKSVGGIGHPLNPWGTGKAPGSALPNLVHPKDPDAVVGFGPIARGLRQRKVLRGALSAASLDELFLELPPDFDWNYFQAAPPDQQLASIVGNEWIVLEGMNPSLSRISSRLPTVRPIATLFGLNPGKPDDAKTVQARIDMIRIDADQLTCSVISRAVIPVDNERTLQSLRIVAAVETEELTYSHLLTPPKTKPQQLEKMTFPIAASKNEPANGTLVLGDSAPAKKPLPFAATKGNEIEDAATIDMDISSHHEEGNKPATPFPAPGPKRNSGSRRAPIPGAPWSPEPVGKTKPPRTREATLTEADVTLATLDETTRKFVKPDLNALGPPSAPVIPPAPFPTASAEIAPRPAAVVHTTPQSEVRTESERKPPEGPKKEMWAKTATELPIALVKPPPPPPRIPAKPAVNKAIYGGFGPPKKKT